jgi:hypothetical protein
LAKLKAIVIESVVNREYINSQYTIKYFFASKK